MRSLPQFMTGALVAVVLAGGCGRDAATSTGYAGLRALAGATRVQLLVPEALDRTRLERLANDLEARGRWDVAFEPGRELDDDAARIWIADARSAGIGEFAQLRGIVFESTGAFWFQGERYEKPGDGLRLTLPDPSRPNWPITLYLAATAADAAALVETLEPAWRPSARAWRDGLIVHDWIGDARGGWNESSGRASLTEALAAPTRALLDVDFEVVTHGEVDGRALDDYRKQLANVRERVIAVLGPPTSAGAPLRIHVWSRLDQLAMAAGAWELSTRGVRDGEVHALLEASGANDSGAGYARALAVRIAGEPRESWALEGLALEASGQWLGAALDRWLAWVCAASSTPALEAILTPVRRASPHRVGPLRALAFRFATRGRTCEESRADWSAGTLAVRVDRDAFSKQVDALRIEGEHVLREVSERARAARETLASQRGVHLVAARDDDGRRALGYGSWSCAQALATLASAGATTVILAPTVCRADEAEPGGGAPGTEPFDSTPSDAALWVALRQARAAGLEVVLAPQLWSSRSGGLAGRMQYADEADWAGFFGDLETLAEHYGWLAELGGASTLCLADQIPEASADRIETSDGWPAPTHFALNTQRWRAVIAAARRSFSGRLTYLAGVDGEADAIAFWPELDCVSLTLHQSVTHPRYEGGAPDERGAEVLDSSFIRAAVGVGARWGKPVWLMRIGFAPTTESWSMPRAALGGYDTVEQERMLRAFAGGLDRAREQGEAPQAVFYWNWTTDPEHGNGVDRSFTLQNRPAAELLPRLMQRP